MKDINKFKFTKTKLTSLKPSLKIRDVYHDTEAHGLQLQVGRTGIKSFYVVKKLNGRPLYSSLGRFPSMTIDQARRQTAKKVSDILDGVNPNKAKREAKIKGITLKQCLSDYLNARSSLATNTKTGYQGLVDKHLSTWKTKELKDINRKMVSDKHQKIKTTHPIAANNVMRLLRALFNFATGEYLNQNDKPLFTDNPVSSISHKRQWSSEKRRQTIIKSGELAGWFMAVNALRDPEKGDINAPPSLVADYLEFVLLTGLRRDDALKLEWDQIELGAATMRPVIHKKSKEVVALPLPKRVLAMLNRRHASKVNEYVFAGRYGNGRFDDPKKLIAKVAEQTGIKFSSHDLRRTFITIAEGLELSAYTIKSLCTHSIGKDVTGGYVIINEERLRDPSQRVEDAILKRAGLLPSANVVAINDPRKSTY